MTLRVLVVTPWFPNDPTDATGNFVRDSVEALRDEGVALSVLVTRPWTPRIFASLHPDWDRPPLRREKFDPTLNLEVAHFPSLPRGYWNEMYGPLFRVGTRSSMRRIARRLSPQLIHAHTESVGCGVMPLAKLLRLPVVTTLHGINMQPRMLDTDFKRRRLRRGLRDTARVVIVGEPLRAHFRAIAGHDDHFRVVPNGFSVPEQSSARAPLESSATLRWISVSNLHEGKGIDLTLNALAALNRVGLVDWSYDVIGDGAERASLETLANALGVGDKVIFRGRLPHDETVRLVGNADAFVLPSYREAFGVAYLEAMALGLLAIGVEGQGPAAFIESNNTGLLVRPNDVESLSAAMKFAYCNREEARPIAMAGQRRVRAEFTWRRHAEKLVAVYEEAIDAP
jgi:glycosyltransferase involved in cell wall biosynthesis